MQTFVVGVDRGLISAAVILAGLATVVVAVFQGSGVHVAVPLLFVVAVVAVAGSRLVRWHSLVAAILLVILFIPIRRYSIPGSLPFDLEPYRVLVAVVSAGWLTSLLIDRRLHARRTGFDGPIALIALSVLLSDVANPNRVGSLSTEVTKRITFFASFFLVLYLIRSVIRSRGELDFLVKLLAASGAVLGALTVIESRTGFNLFDHLQSFIPLLRFHGLSWSDTHTYHQRAFGSSEHPIAMGAGLVLIIPLAVYLVHSTRQHRWRVATALLLFGTLATRSRTSIVMLLALGLVYCVLRWSEMKRLWPLLIPLLVVSHIALPGVYGGLYGKFFPKGGLIAQQKIGAGGYGSGRIADLGPGLREWTHHPFVGEGFGTRITARGQATTPNAPILDDQWLGTLLETGALGVAAWIWLFARFIRRLGGAARRDRTPRGWLLAGLAASIAASAAGMFFYDTFSFTQEVFILFISLGLGAVAIGDDDSRTVTVRTARSTQGVGRVKASIAPVT